MIDHKEDHFFEQFSQCTADIVGLEVNRVRNSIGSHVSFGFGEDISVVLPCGKDYLRRSWQINLGSSAWRIIRNGKYIAGSLDARSMILEGIQQLMKKRLISIEIVSTLMDIRISFDQGYTIDTFVHCARRGQWVLFCPDRSNLAIDFETPEQRTKIKHRGQKMQIHNYYQTVLTGIEGQVINHAELDDGSLILRLTENRHVAIDIWTWRLERNGELYACCVFDLKDQPALDEARKKISALDGQVLRRVDVASEILDTRFYIGDEYVLSTFVCNSNAKNEWGTEWGIYDHDWELITSYPPPKNTLKKSVV